MQSDSRNQFRCAVVMNRIAAHSMKYGSVYIPGRVIPREKERKEIKIL